MSVDGRLTVHGMSRVGDGRDCEIVDRWDLAAAGEPMQIECLTCGKLMPEGNRYACRISDEELAADWVRWRAQHAGYVKDGSEPARQASAAKRASERAAAFTKEMTMATDTPRHPRSPLPATKNPFDAHPQVDDGPPTPKNPPPLAGSLTGASPSAGAAEAYGDKVLEEHAADNSENEHRRMVKAKQAAKSA